MNPTDPVQQSAQPTPVPTPIAQPQPVVQYAPTQPANIPFGLIGLVVSSVGLIVLPIIQANMGSSYLLLFITLLIGGAGVALSIFGLKKSQQLNVLAISGLMVGIFVTSYSFVYTLNYGISYANVKAASQKALEKYNSLYDN